MYYFVTDETNVDPSKDFFLYGGLIVSDEQLFAIHHGIEKIRADRGFAPTDKLKFGTNELRGSGVTRDQHTAAKNDVLDLCHRTGAKFVGYLVHQRLAKQDKKTEWAVNSLLSVFNDKFLTANDAWGMVIIDRLPDGQAYRMLKSRFQEGLSFDNGQVRRLERVLMYATTCDGASHISSAVDICLGAFRYAVNGQGDPGIRQKLLRNIVRMMYSSDMGGRTYIREFGLITRPRTFRSPLYEKATNDLVAYLESLLKD